MSACGKDIELIVDQDRINDPFFEVSIITNPYREEQPEAHIETKKAIEMAREAQPKADKIVIYRGKVRHEIIIRTARGGIMGWERMVLRGTVDHVIGSRAWKSCEELGVIDG